MTYYLSTQIFSLLRCFIKYIYIFLLKKKLQLKTKMMNLCNSIYVINWRINDHFCKL